MEVVLFLQSRYFACCFSFFPKTRWSMLNLNSREIWLWNVASSLSLAPPLLRSVITSDLVVALEVQSSPTFRGREDVPVCEAPSFSFFVKSTQAPCLLTHSFTSSHYFCFPSFFLLQFLKEKQHKHTSCCSIPTPAPFIITAEHHRLATTTQFSEGETKREQKKEKKKETWWNLIVLISSFMSWK